MGELKRPDHHAHLFRDEITSQDERAAVARCDPQNNKTRRRLALVRAQDGMCTFEEACARYPQPQAAAEDWATTTIGSAEDTATSSAPQATVQGGEGGVDGAGAAAAAAGVVVFRATHSSLTVWSLAQKRSLMFALTSLVPDTCRQIATAEGPTPTQVFRVFSACRQ